MESFRLFNIKSFIDTNNVELKPITVFVGKNSSGKSSLLRFLALIKQTFIEDVETPLLLFGKLIDYGNFDDVIYNHIGDTFKFKLNFKAESIINYSRYLNIKSLKDNLKGEISISITIQKIKKRMIVNEIVLFFNDISAIKITNTDKNNYSFYFGKLINRNMELIDIPQFTSKNPCNLIINNILFEKFIPNILFLSRNDLGKIVFEFINNNFNNIINVKSTSELIIRSFNERDLLMQRRNYNSNDRQLRLSLNTKENIIKDIYENYMNTLFIISFLFNGISRSIESFSNELAYIGPFRKDPERNYRDNENTYDDVGKNGENTINLIRQAQRKRNSNLLKKISNWFSSSMDYKIKINEIKGSNFFNLMILSNKNNTSDNLIDVGFGISQVLPIVTQLYHKGELARYFFNRSHEKKTFIIEQPELHLHPNAQTQLADLFVEKITKDHNSKIIIETHSEHLIRKLQVLVADPDSDLKPANIIFYYVDKDNNTNSKITKMELNKNGQFINEWPSRFFDNSYNLSKQLLYFAK